MKVTSVPESWVVLTPTRSAPAPIIASPCFPRLTLVPESPPCAPSVDGGVDAPELAAARATVGVRKSIRLPADRRLCSMFVLLRPA